jgi:hypothetical protein
MLGQRWRDHAVPVAGVLVLVASFLPWYGVGVAGFQFVYEYTFTGWSASWLWSLALVLSMVAAGVWRPFRTDFGVVPTRIRYALLAMTLIAMGLALWQGQLLTQSAELRRSLLAASSGEDVPLGVVASNHTASLIEGLRWGYTVGLVAMGLVAFALLTSGSAGGRRPTARG